MLSEILCRSCYKIPALPVECNVKSKQVFSTDCTWLYKGSLGARWEKLNINILLNLYLSFVMHVYSFKPYNVRVIITKFLIVKYECLTKQIGDGNKAHDYTRGIYGVIDIVTPILSPSGGLLIYFKSIWGGA